MNYPDIVVLVPGFLGFSRVGGYYYFADRVSAAIRGALESQLGRPVPVIPACSLPTDHLAKRQIELVDQLARITARIGGVRRIHLVGHSVGGVDAQLLTCDRPLASDRWTVEAKQLNDKIATLVTIASPHHGTCLADAPIAALLADPLRHLQILPALAVPLANLARLVAAQSDSPVIAAYMLRNLPESSRFLWNIVMHRGLITDTSPRAMAAVRAHSVCSRKRFTRCYVTAVPDAGSAEPFFKDLWRLTSNTEESPANEAVIRTLELLHAHAGEAIREGGPALQFDDRTNDGVVNSARQVLDPGDAQQLAGMVVADHADVIGHYDRQDSLVTGESLNVGLFHSGAGFGDDSFFELYRRVAADLVTSIRAQ
jgi:pimeloyl-ACP methyl ester carboxylesterase